jgi:ABC-type Fe3+-hydroxamate transport system substrate-binding protein
VDVPAVSVSVSVVLPPANGEVRVADGAVIERSANAFTVAFADDVELPPGEAVVVVVHDEPAEIVLAVGMAPDGSTPHHRLRVVERRS